MGPVRGYKKKKKNSADYLSSGSTLVWFEGFLKKYPVLLAPLNGPDGFKCMFKISSSTFDYICSLIKDFGNPPNFIFSNGTKITLHDRVAIALRRLGFGDSLISIADMFGIHHSTVSQVTWRFVEAIEERGISHLQWPDEQDMEKIKLDFENIKGFPNCCGAIGTTHISFLPPLTENGADLWLDREKNHSMMLQAIVDPNMRFLSVLTGFPGKMNDFSVLQCSNFYNLCEKGEGLNGCSVELSGGKKIREYIVGDSSFPLLPWLITPYQSKATAKVVKNAEIGFNNRHFETREVAHRALTRLKKRWKIIEGLMWRPDKNRLPRIILVCCILQNILIDLHDEMAEETHWGHDHDVGYKQETCEVADRTAKALRNKILHHLLPRELNRHVLLT